MDREKSMLQEAFSDYKGVLKNYLMRAKNFQRFSKPAEASEVFRQEGNILYKQKHHNDDIHLQIFRNYCRAILAAPNDSEHLAIGYGNRSAFLLHIDRYKDCIKDIDRAVKITKSNTLKIKLLCRKAECERKLGSEEESTLKEAEKYVDTIVDKECKKNYRKLVDKVKTMSINAESCPEKVETILETRDAFEQININYNKKFGRHLVATKDYAPGDIIFIEKIYASHINPTMIYTNCDYCLKTAWSGIPCRYCSWTIFCSEECRDKSWKLYHDVECSLIPFLKLLSELSNMIKLNLRVAIIAIKEAGSVSKLKSRLKAVDDCTDPCLKGFYKTNEFKSNTIESLYSLCSYYPEPDSVFHGQATTVLMVLIGLVTRTNLFKNISLKKIDDLIQNDDLLFLGSLIMKLIMIRRNTNDALYGKYDICEQGNNMEQCYATSCCTRGFYMASLTSLINHSCFPNAARCFTDDKQIIIHAIHPIKKNEQIFMAYACHFYNNPLPERQEMLKVRNIFECFCQPCKENWLPLLIMPEKQLKKYKFQMNSKLEKKLYDDCSRILAVLQNSMLKNKFNYFKKEDLEELSKAVTEAFQHLKQPSYLTCLLVESLDEVFSYIHGLKPRNFGKSECCQK